MDITFIVTEKSQIPNPDGSITYANTIQPTTTGTEGAFTATTLDSVEDSFFVIGATYTATITQN